MSLDHRLIRILTVDDHALLGEGIAALVNAEPDMKLVAEASNGEKAIEQFRLHRPDVTLMDLQMPGFNARAYILKGHVHRELPETVRAVHAGQSEYPRRLPPSSLNMRRMTP